MPKLQEIVNRVAIAQRSAYLPNCPCCGEAVMKCTKDLKTDGYLSNQANIHICEICAMEEAAEDYYEKNIATPLSKWSLFNEKSMGLSNGSTEEQLIENAAGYTNPTIYFLGSPDKLLFNGLHLAGSTKCNAQDYLRNFQAGKSNLLTADIYMVRDLENPVDTNAVEIWYKGNGKNQKLGFVAASQVPIVATCLDNGGTVRIIKHDIIGEPDSFCGLFMAAEIVFP